MGRWQRHAEGGEVDAEGRKDDHHQRTDQEGLRVRRRPVAPARFYNFAGKRAQGTTESAEYVPYERIVDMAKGDVESTITWSFSGENGTTEVKFEADYQAPQKFFPISEQGFITRRNEFEAETLLANLKAKLEV